MTRKTDYNVTAIPEAVPADLHAGVAPAGRGAPAPSNVSNRQRATAWYFAPVVVILSLICCFPLGLILLWVGRLWTQTIRIVVTGTLAFLVIAVSVSQHSRPTGVTDSGSAVNGASASGTSSSSGGASPAVETGGGATPVHDWINARPPEEWEAMTAGKTYEVFGHVGDSHDGWNLFTRKDSRFRFVFSDSEAASALLAGELSKRSFKRAYVLISARYAGTKDIRTTNSLLFSPDDPRAKETEKVHAFESVQFKGLAFDYEEMFRGKPERGTVYLVQGKFEGSVDGYELIHTLPEWKIAFRLSTPVEQASGGTVTIIGEFDGFKDFKTVLGAPLRVPFLNNAELLE
ncbi:MAG: hypothetical protein HYY93_06735 [Planctomycetes bacterium]|nr:hypothetical protein [Planctomycetota bacterium]